MKNSAIQWTDHTFNPWEGCTKVAPECKNCYAETLVDTRFGRVKWGKGQPRRRTSKSYWNQPLRWNKIGEKRRISELHSVPAGEPHHFRRERVFCLSLGDWLDEEVPSEWLADLLRLIHDTQNLDWLLLTKRPQNWRQRITQAAMSIPGNNSDYDKMIGMVSVWGLPKPQPPPNIWIGVSAGADQRAALDIPAKVHFLSCEPMLHGLNVNNPEPFQTVARFDWIIFGGESGRNARTLDVDWIRAGLAFCRANGIAPFVKQLGANAMGREIDKWVARIRDSHGGDINEWPDEFRVREFPITT